MRTIKIEKVTLNIGAGKNIELLKKGLRLLQKITEVKPVQTFTQKRIPTWGLRPGLPIGCKVTLRNGNVKDMIMRLLDAKANILEETNFDDNGSISFGIPEYIDIKDVKYDPEIGIIGLQVCITLQRPGFRIKRRKMYQKRVPKKHRINRQESIAFMQKEFKVEIGEEA